ncbi:hypothetical protein P9293_20215 [Bacillus inaquosorum]|uniref:hypothetical protein n=1 Tax=Bacillus subtilis group TaxID=653685 RepID=UPI000D034AAD|nr:MULTISPECIES: hypothetical protein [Bacillus subtilis group]MBJ7570858.1 hypothetical protein [Bacillus halotolerans]MED4649671.1 hypothetical protein [Bacillus inaquosorum]MED4790603.1 hypothetical protein [Bacillus inaquosorum]PRP56818.1 hypothetical protein C7B71_02415 [Bacillus halotolerans]
MNWDFLRFIIIPIIVVILTAALSYILTTKAETKRRIFDKKYDLYLEFVQIISSAVRAQASDKMALASDLLAIKMKVTLICNKEIIDLFLDIGELDLRDAKKLRLFYDVMLLMRKELGLSNDSLDIQQLDRLLNNKANNSL